MLRWCLKKKLTYVQGVSNGYYPHLFSTGKNKKKYTFDISKCIILSTILKEMFHWGNCYMKKFCLCLEKRRSAIKELNDFDPNIFCFLSHHYICIHSSEISKRLFNQRNVPVKYFTIYFLIHKIDIVNFEAFSKKISLNTNLVFLKSLFTIMCVKKRYIQKSQKLHYLYLWLMSEEELEWIRDRNLEFEWDSSLSWAGFAVVNHIQSLQKNHLRLWSI